MKPPALSLTIQQTIFLVFYAIFWGGIFNAQVRWKAFHWPLVFRFRQARCRAIGSLILLNLLPIGFFFLAMTKLSRPQLTESASTCILIWEYTRPVIAAFAIFAFYRLWIGVIEHWPDDFYAASTADIPARYQHVEPTYRRELSEPPEGPFVDIGSDTACPNLISATAYLLVAIAALFVN